MKGTPLQEAYKALGLTFGDFGRNKKRNQGFRYIVSRIDSAGVHTVLQSIYRFNDDPTNVAAIVDRFKDLNSTYLQGVG